jgi:hypothetical protein
MHDPRSSANPSLPHSDVKAISPVSTARPAADSARTIYSYIREKSTRCPATIVIEFSSWTDGHHHPRRVVGTDNRMGREQQPILAPLKRRAVSDGPRGARRSSRRGLPPHRRPSPALCHFALQLRPRIRLGHDPIDDADEKTPEGRAFEPCGVHRDGNLGDQRKGCSPPPLTVE